MRKLINKVQQPENRIKNQGGYPAFQIHKTEKPPKYIPNTQYRRYLTCAATQNHTVLAFYSQIYFS